ncbi:MAG: GDP-mannose 4,6-dehydratase [Candidatus Azambacteria bacterium]|nr:GDP-mannose 4,6-dehydratase [Candidatus Azambacteria bacterium]
MGKNKKEKTAFITGVTGQDGSYLAEFLLKKNYIVHGLIRRSSTFNVERIKHLLNYPHQDERLFLHYGDLSDSSSINSIMAKTNPDEIYNLGSQSHVRVSFDIPEYTADITGVGVLRMLEAMKRYTPSAKFYQASSSEMFGDVKETPQNENTPFKAQSPYGIAKVFAHETAGRYRDAYSLFISCGILFNHESPRRGENFVTKKIVQNVALIKMGLQDKIYLGNLESKRDWGYAPEYVEAMWLMLQQEKSDDFVIATGETHTIKEFVEAAFKRVGIKNWEKYVAIDERYYRPNEVNILQGDAGKAKKILGWQPKTKFTALVNLMMDYELKNDENLFHN